MTRGARGSPGSAPARDGGVSLRRACACGNRTGEGSCDECKKKPQASLNRKASAATKEDVPAAVHAVLRSNGEPLEEGARGFFESRFSADLSHVRVHTNAEAAESASAVNALAYTVGQHVVFGANRYEPQTAPGRELLAHELAHVLQQTSWQPGATLRIDDSHEGGADAAAHAALNGTVPTAPGPAVPSFVGRQMPAPAPMPVRPPPALRALPGGNTAPGLGRPVPVPGGGQRYAQEQQPGGKDLYQMYEDQLEDDREEVFVMQQERPVATLERGGSPPTFVSEAGKKQVSSPRGRTVVVRDRRYHVLDVIDHEVDKVNTEEELEQVLERHVPAVAEMHRGIEALKRRRRELTPLIAPKIQLPGDTPRFPRDLDPQGAKRIETFQTAVARRSKAQPALANSRLLPRQQRRRGNCSFEPISPLGSDPLSAVYCHFAADSPYSYIVRVLGANGQPTQRWAEIDALKGDTWFECKCGYEELLKKLSKGDRESADIHDKMTKQVLNHMTIAQECGLNYQFLVSSEWVRDSLKGRWFGVDIRQVPWEPCD